MTPAQINKLSEICYEITRKYALTVKDGVRPIPWDQLPTEEKLDVRNRVELLLSNPLLAPEQLHEKWLDQKTRQGWVYSHKVDEARKTHPRMRRYTDLNNHQRFKDEVFHSVVKAAALGDLPG